LQGQVGGLAFVVAFENAVSKRSKVGLALVAGSLLAASCAVDARSLDDAVVYSAAPVSTLVSRRDLQFKLGHAQRGACRVTLLAHQAAGAEPRPVAMISSWQSDQGARVSVHRLFQSATLDTSDLDVAALEHLYALALRQEPVARFAFADGVPPCESARDDYSHAEFLRELARIRERAVARPDHRGTGVAWHVVSMAPAQTNRADADEVGIRVVSDQGPMAGTTIFFNRAPHSGCVARSGQDGVATCRLVDQHGDDESHSEDGAAPVVATFPGDVRAGRFLLPTTFVLQPAP
jgi:hypothetical protein